MVILRRHHSRLREVTFYSFCNERWYCDGGRCEAEDPLMHFRLSFVLKPVFSKLAQRFYLWIRINQQYFFCQEKTNRIDFLIFNSCFVGSVYTHQYGVFYVTISIGYYMHYPLERKGKRLEEEWNGSLLSYTIGWLMVRGEGERHDGILRHQTPHLIKFCCKARHSINPYYALIQLAVCASPYNIFLLGY